MALPWTCLGPLGIEPEISTSRYGSAHFYAEVLAVSEDIGGSLWNEHVTSMSYAEAGERYQQALLEQYKLFVEMADRTSNRRILTNTFFLTLNTGLLTTLAGVLSHKRITASHLVIPLIALMMECLVWFTLIRSYRLLNSTKYRIVCTLEQKLPAKPWSAEWSRLGTGAGVGRYRRLSLSERWVPLFFAVFYLAGFFLYSFT